MNLLKEKELEEKTMIQEIIFFLALIGALVFFDHMVEKHQLIFIVFEFFARFLG